MKHGGCREGKGGNRTGPWQWAVSANPRAGFTKMFPQTLQGYPTSLEMRRGDVMKLVT